MLAKLALRNVKRQIGNYFIYFMTVSLTVALLFAVVNIIFGDNLQRFTFSSKQLKSALLGFVILISFIVAFVLSYATSFMLKLRKREFGTYLTLGMSRRNILTLFLSETLLICIVALGLGLALGLFLYQGMAAVFMHILETEFTLAAYSQKGLLLTIFLTLGIFLLASLTSAIYLKRVSIYDLIHGGKKVEKSVKHPLFWTLAALLSFIILVGSILFFNRELEQNILHEDTAEGLLSALFALALSLIIFHIALAKSLMYIFLHRKNFCCRGTNTFLLRQLSGTLSSSSIMLGFLAFLLSFAVIGSNVCFLEKTVEESFLNQLYPCDIRYEKILKPEFSSVNSSPEEGIPPVKAEEIIEKYIKIENKHEYAFYTTGRYDFYNQTRWSGEGYEVLIDSFMKLSDFNALIMPLGYEAVTLQQEYLIVARRVEIAQLDWSRFTFEQNGVSYQFHSIHQEYPKFNYQHFYVVLPDEAFDGMELARKYIDYTTEKKKYDARSLSEELSYPAENTWEDQGGTYLASDYSLREAARESLNAGNAILVVGALFTAAIFLFMAMAILALKTLSALSSDKHRYEILDRLGAGTALQKRTLACQIFSFFMLPFLIPLLLGIPTALISHNMFTLLGIPSPTLQICTIASSIAAVMLFIYLLYYIATYHIAKRAVIRPKIL